MAPEYNKLESLYGEFFKTPEGLHQFNEDDYSLVERIAEENHLPLLTYGKDGVLVHMSIIEEIKARFKHGDLTKVAPNEAAPTVDIYNLMTPNKGPYDLPYVPSAEHIAKLKEIKTESDLKVAAVIQDLAAMSPEERTAIINKVKLLFPE